MFKALMIWQGTQGKAYSASTIHVMTGLSPSMEYFFDPRNVILHLLVRITEALTEKVNNAQPQEVDGVTATNNQDESWYFGQGWKDSSQRERVGASTFNGPVYYMSLQGIVTSIIG